MSTEAWVILGSMLAIFAYGALRILLNGREPGDQHTDETESDDSVDQ